MKVEDSQADENRFTVAAHFLRVLTDYLSRHSLDSVMICRKAGIEDEAIEDPNGRIQYNKYSIACELASNKLNDPDLGLKLGSCIRIEHLGSHGFALASCSSGRELIAQHSRYSALTMDIAHSEFEFSPSVSVRKWVSNLAGGKPLGRLQDDLNQASVITLARSFANREEISPNWVSFRHIEPEDISEYERVFRCPIRFGAEFTGMGFDTALLDIPMSYGNPQLRLVMENVCAQLLQKQGSSIEPTWLAIAKKTVVESFSLGMSEIEIVAQATGLSVQEFKQKLSERDTSFRGFVDELRQRMALGYMRDPSFSLVDVAFLLGFSEQSAFQRAFKRWTGKTPGEFRQIR